MESSPIGVTRIDDLSKSDVEIIKRRALIELTTILENNEIQIKVRKAPKRKYRESGVFGVPIVTMVDRDKMIDPMTRTPIFLQEVCLQILYYELSKTIHLVCWQIIAFLEGKGETFCGGLFEIVFLF
jgi:hypothetical protein